jgi:hypothetical protein
MAVTIAFTTSAGNIRPTGTITCSTISVNDVFVMQYGRDATFATYDVSQTNTLDSSELAALALSFTFGAFQAATYYFRVSQNGTWSNTLSSTMNGLVPYTLHCV